MTGITLTGEKNLLLFSGRAHPALTAEIAGCLGIEPTPTKLSDFANGEVYVRFLESVRGCDAFVMQSHTATRSSALRPNGLPSSRRSSATRARTRRTVAASPSPPG